MSPRRAAAVIAAVVLAVGVVLAVMPLSVGLLSDEVGCGSAFQPRYTQADIRDIVERPLIGSYVGQCEDEVSGRRLVAYPLVGLSTLALLFLWLTGQHTTRWDGEKSPAGEGAA